MPVILQGFSPAFYLPAAQGRALVPLQNLSKLRLSIVEVIKVLLNAKSFGITREQRARPIIYLKYENSWLQIIDTQFKKV